MFHLVGAGMTASSASQRATLRRNSLSSSGLARQSSIPAARRGLLALALFTNRAPAADR